MTRTFKCSQIASGPEREVDQQEVDQQSCVRDGIDRFVIEIARVYDPYGDRNRFVIKIARFRDPYGEQDR